MRHILACGGTAHFKPDRGLRDGGAQEYILARRKCVMEDTDLTTTDTRRTNRWDAEGAACDQTY
jgi:hypothetical protein